MERKTSSLPAQPFEAVAAEISVVVDAAAGFWKGRQLSGVEIDVDDPHVFPSVRTAVELMCAARDMGFVHIHTAHTMDLDWGTDTVRKALLAGASPDDIIAGWQSEIPAFLTLRDHYLLY
jgi:uncharacterized protein YbbC (DUF1343 family)